MTIIVQKFGGTSLANVDRIKSVARRVKAEQDQGHQVVVVVSAMAGVTNQLVGWAHQCVNQQLTASEYDVVVSSGEQVTAGLMSLALNDLGIQSRSWLSWQLPIRTDVQHKNATIQEIDTRELSASLQQNKVAVVAGFQGLTQDNRISTVGRGGSDYTAIALAVALKADRCDIYTDVDGVFTADPRLITDAKKLDHLSYQDVLELAGHGAKVLQPQSVESAAEGNIPIRVLSSFNFNDGTLISEKSHTSRYLGITSRSDRSAFILELIGNADQISKEIQTAFQNASIETDYSCKFQPDGRNLTLIIARDDYEEAESILNKFQDSQIQFKTKLVRVAQVAVVSHKSISPEITSNIANLLSEKEISIYEIRIDVSAVTALLPVDKMEEAVKVLHTQFILQTHIQEVA